MVEAWAQRQDPFKLLTQQFKLRNSSWQEEACADRDGQYLL